MPGSASELIARHRAAHAAAGAESRLDRLARRFGNISIAATLLMAPLTAAGGYIAFRPGPGLSMGVPAIAVPAIAVPAIAAPVLSAPAQAAQTQRAPLRLQSL